MSSLVVLGFDGIHTADEVLNKLRPLQKQNLIDLEDACVVERDSERQDPHQAGGQPDGARRRRREQRGMLWGTLVGLLFLNPLAGMAIGTITGAGVGALSARLVDFGIDDEFIKKLGETIPPRIVCAVRAGPERDGRQGAAGDRAVQAARAEDQPLQRQRR